MGYKCLRKLKLEKNKLLYENNTESRWVNTDLLLSPFLLHTETLGGKTEGKKGKFKKKKHGGSANVQVGEANLSDKVHTEDFSVLLWGLEQRS